MQLEVCYCKQHRIDVGTKAKIPGEVPFGRNAKLLKEMMTAQREMKKHLRKEEGWVLRIVSYKLLPSSHMIKRSNTMRTQGLENSVVLVYYN